MPLRWPVFWLSMLCLAACAGAAASASEPAATGPSIKAAPTGPIRLIVRGDDLGALHGINVGCEKAIKQGIMSAAEVIVPGPWFPEAVRLLKANPQVDVGVHLTITSEWSNVKWRPLTSAPSLVDGDGFFRPFIWPNKELPGASHNEAASWKLAEIESELRAQIVLLKKHLPRVSHGGCHMGCGSLDPSVRDLIARLLSEYGLKPDRVNLKHLPMQPLQVPPGKVPTWQEREAALVAALEKVGPGDYEIGEHPASDDAEMRAVSHPGYENVAEDRASVVAAWTSPIVKQVIARRGIKVIGFRDLAKRK